jgi:hypothetical protein
MALALVKLRREFDPAVAEALRLIDSPSRRDLPETKEARIALQKLHQMQSVFELHELTKHAESDHPKDERLLNAVVASRWQAQSFKGGVYVDLLDLCSCLQARLADEGVKRLCGDVREAVVDCTKGAYLTGPDSQHAHGLSVYFPYQNGDYTPEYDNLAFAKKTGWGRLVLSYLRATRRERQGESEHWKRPQDHVLRFGHNEVDLLEPEGIEARIVGVIAPSAPAGSDGAKAQGKAGTEAKIRAGTEAKIRAGTEAKIRGDGVQFVWGNPPDGFFEQDARV